MFQNIAWKKKNINDTDTSQEDWNPLRAKRSEKTSLGKQPNLFTTIHLFQSYVVAVSFKRYFGVANKFAFFHLLHFVAFWPHFFF